MALSEQKLLALQIDYELGELSKSQICKNHRISRPTLRKHATENGWLYQKSFQEVSNEVRARVTEKIIERNSEEIVKATEIFLDNSSEIRDFIMDGITKLKENIKEAEWDFTDIDLQSFQSLQRLNEIVSKALTNLYTTDRKALGLDRDEDIQKAHAIKSGPGEKERRSKYDSMTDDEMKEEKKRLLDELKELDE